MNGRTLRSTAGVAGTVAAAAAGALTVGLISGVVHTAQAQSATTSSSHSGSTSTSGTAKSGTSSTRTSGSVQNAPRNAAPVGGSHGS
jgi:hypothetical protein